MSLARTALSLIDEARTRHHAFLSATVPDGVFVMGLNTKLRSLLLQYADAIQTLVDQSVSVAATVSGALVGVDSSGNPYYLTTPGTGYAVSNAGTPTNPIPYVDFSGVPISTDPFGQNGGTPGFPLPTDMIKLITVTSTFSDGTLADIDIIPERMRFQNPTHNAQAFINGNRLVPVRLGAPPYYDWWTNVTGVSVTFIAPQTVAYFTDTFSYPIVLYEALIAHLAKMLAYTIKEVTLPERQLFDSASKQADADFMTAGKDLVMQLTETSVIYHE